MGTVNICVGNNLIIDFEIFSYWLNGNSVEECKEILTKKHFKIKEKINENIILNDTIDHYYIFSQLEQYLQTPPRLKEQLLFQISEEDTNKLIEL